MTDEPGWSLTFRFPNQAPDFAHGFACGRLWEQMKTPGALIIDTTEVSENRETIEAMAMSLGWVEDITELAHGWLHVILRKSDGPSMGSPIVPELSPGKPP